MRRTDIQGIRAIAREANWGNMSLSRALEAITQDLGGLLVGTSLPPKEGRVHLPVPQTTTRLDSGGIPTGTLELQLEQDALRAVGVPMVALWAAGMGDPNVPNQRRALGRPLLPELWLPRGNGYGFTTTAGGDCTLYGHKLLVEALRLETLERFTTIGSIAVVAANGAIEIPDEPWQYGLIGPRQAVACLEVRGNDLATCFFDGSITTYNYESTPYPTS